MIPSSNFLYLLLDCLPRFFLFLKKRKFQQCHKNQAFLLIIVGCKELADEFSDIHFSKDNLVEAILNIFNKTNEKFVFILGEYDCLFRDYPNEKEEVKAYLNLLRGLFKGAIGDRAVALAYMTGIFPIGRYDTQSALNNFDQISMLNTFRLGKFVGFTG